MTGPAGPEQAVEDLATILAVASGDRSAFGALYDRYAGTVLALCLRVLGDRAEAEEVVGDVFWQVWREADRFDPSRGNVIAWLTTLARTRAIDRRRAVARRSAWVVADAVGDGDPPRSERLAGAADPLEDAVVAERGVRVRRALATLAPDQRRAVELNFFDGLSHSEIADTLREPLGTIKTRIRAGLMRLKEALGGELAGGAAR